MRRKLPIGQIDYLYTHKTYAKEIDQSNMVTNVDVGGRPWGAAQGQAGRLALSSLSLFRNNIYSPSLSSLS